MTVTVTVTSGRSTVLRVGGLSSAIIGPPVHQPRGQRKTAARLGERSLEGWDGFNSVRLPAPSMLSMRSMRR